MKAIFVHDHPFYSDGSLYYSDKLPYGTWQRYLEHFDELTVFARLSADAACLEKQPLSSGPKVRFLFGQNISSLNGVLNVRRAEKRRLERLVVDHDAVISRLPSEYGLLAVAIAKKIGKPYIIEVVGCPWDALWNYGSLKPKVYAPFLTMRMKRAVAEAGCVSYVSQDFLQNRYPAKDNAIVAAISNVEISESSDSILVKRIGRIKQNKPKVIFGLIGSLKTRYKGVHTAINALSLLSSHLFDFELHVLGSGEIEPYKKMAEKLGIAEKIFFDGTLPSGIAVSNWLDKIDVYLQPSFQEGVPRALIEAMSRGCPSLASSAGGIPELLDEGCTFKPGDVKLLANLLKLKSCDISWREVQAIRNFKISKKYSKNILDNRRTKLFNEFVDSVEQTNERK